MATKKSPARAKTSSAKKSSPKKSAKLSSNRWFVVGLFVLIVAVIGAALLYLSNAATTTKTLTFTASDDSYASKNVPTLVRNDRTEVKLANSDFPCTGNTTCSDGTKVPYLKFNVSGIPSGAIVNSVKLKLYVTNAGPDGGTVYKAKSSNWTEKTLTWNNQPGYETAPLASFGGVEANTWREVELVGHGIVKDGAVSFAIANKDNNVVWYAVHETANKPTLTLTYTPAASWTARFPGDPKPGTMYYGGSDESGDPAAFEAKNGVKYGVYRSYMRGDTPTSKFVDRASKDINAGRIPLISTKLPDSWANVAAGKQDAWLLERIRALAALPGPVWLTLHHEPTGDGSPADWVKMQQHARKLIDANSKNIVLVGILNGYPFKSGQDQSGYNHPVGTGVHIMGFDSYNPWFPGGDKKWQTVEWTLSPGVEIQKWGYPTLVGEYGVRYDAANPGKSAQWMRDAYDYAIKNKFLALAYFNSGQNSPDGPWTLDGERLQVYKENFNKASTYRYQAQ